MRAAHRAGDIGVIESGRGAIESGGTESVRGGGSSLIGWVSRALSVSVIATMSYCGASAGGFASHAMNDPFGHTGVRTPLIVSPASPLPMLPKTKFESREVIVCPAGGYTILISSGPATCGTGGKPGLAGGSGAFSTTRGAGGGEGSTATGSGGVAARGAAHAET